MPETSAPSKLVVMSQQKEPMLAPQLLIALVGLMLWVIWPRPAIWALLLAYGVAWIYLNYAPIPLSKLRVTVGLGVVLALLATVSVATALWRGDLVTGEGLRGFPKLLEDRLRLEAKPSIVPPAIFADHPQTLYAYVPDSRHVQLRLGGETRPIDGQNIGEAD